jgi:co-chaperonin GroES (HSP10)
MATENPFDQKIGYKFRNKIKSLTPLHDHVIVTEMNFSGRKLASGVILLGDDGKTDGIRPRWAKVYAVGPDQTEVNVGQWVLVEHGRWSRGVLVEIDEQELTLRRADPQCLLMVSDEEPTTAIEGMSTAVYGERNERVNWAEE